MYRMYFLTWFCFFCVAGDQDLKFYLTSGYFWAKTEQVSLVYALFMSSIDILFIA